jgi:thiosulfate/3-mercaptopyruvate sulfurtransferase
MHYAHPEHLISPSEVAQRLERRDEHLRLFDCTVFLHPDPPRLRAESGRAEYLKAHLPGAGFLDLLGNLSDAVSPFGFTLPGPDALQAAFRAAGIDDQSQVVLYSTGHLMWATRVWWMLHGAGHRQVALLDGGWPCWRAEGRPVEAGESGYPTGTMTVRLRPGAWADRSEVQAAIGQASTCLVNSLSAEAYDGNSSLHYGRPGHIPGSRHLFYDTLLVGHSLRDADTILAAARRLGAATAETRVVVYCGGGISATVDAFALALVGHPNVAVYDGSLSEWARDPSLPLKTGMEP